MFFIENAITHLLFLLYHGSSFLSRVCSSNQFSNLFLAKKSLFCYSIRHMNTIPSEKTTTILAIETSCDETAAAVVRATATSLEVLGSIVSSQIALHAPFGGVVPSLAAREHARNIVPVLEEALLQSHIRKDAINALAITQGPGLIPALLIGTTAAKTLSYVWNKPLIGIHHIEGHIYANFIDTVRDAKTLFPLLALVVSGGHTQLILMRRHFDYKILGETQDDAVGEAFDKVARMLGLSYPGGPLVAKRADAFKDKQASSTPPLFQHSLLFPRPMLHSGDFNFSFSGLKTAVLYTLKKYPEQLRDENFIDQVCYEFQEAVIETLLAKTQTAIEQYQPATVVIAGGVSANVALRSRLTTLINECFPQTTFLTPRIEYSLDNAAMIGATAALRWQRMTATQKQTASTSWRTLSADAHITLSDHRFTSL